MKKIIKYTFLILFSFFVGCATLFAVSLLELNRFLGYLVLPIRKLFRKK